MMLCPPRYRHHRFQPVHRDRAPCAGVGSSFFFVGCLGVVDRLRQTSSPCPCAPPSSCPRPCPSSCAPKKSDLKKATHKKGEEAATEASAPTKKAAYEFCVAAPGVKQADLSVQVHGRCLIVTGRTDLDDDRKHLAGSFAAVHEVVELPRDADLDAAMSTHKDGVLHFP